MRAARRMRSESVMRRTSTRWIVELRARVGGRDRDPVAMARLDDDWDDVARPPWIGGSSQERATPSWSSSSRARGDTSGSAIVFVSSTSVAGGRLRGTVVARARASRRAAAGCGDRACYQSGEYDAAREAIEEAVGLLSEHGPKDRGGVGADASRRPACRTSTATCDVHPTEVSTSGRALPGGAEPLRARDEPRHDRHDLSSARASGRGGGAADRRHRCCRASGAPGTRRRESHAPGHRASLCGEIEDARRHLDQAVYASLYLEGTAYWLECYAAILLVEGAPTLAATALGAAEGLRERTGIHRWPIMSMVLRDRLAASGVRRAGGRCRTLCRAGR